jgi:hypothetical protein
MSFLFGKSRLYLSVKTILKLLKQQTPTMETVISKNNISIRLTDERWLHIITGHPEMSNYRNEILETITEPDIIYAGSKGDLIAVSKQVEGTNKHIIVAYKEINDDGFIITAYISNKLNSLQKREIIWKP